MDLRHGLSPREAADIKFMTKRQHPHTLAVRLQSFWGFLIQPLRQWLSNAGLPETLSLVTHTVPVGHEVLK